MFNIKCWIAPRDVLPGEYFGAAVVDAIVNASIFVFILSRNSNNSPQVVNEIERAVGKNKTIITFRIDNVVLSKVLEYFLSSRHWMDAQTSPLEKHLERLAGTIKLHIDSNKSPDIKCPKCGADLRADAVFCDRCGVRISKTKKPKTTEKTPEVSIVKELKTVTQTPDVSRIEEPETVTGAAHCPKCGNELRPGASFCNQCGAPVTITKEPETITKTSDVSKTKEPETVTGAARCLKCGNELRPGAVFCNKCGTRVSQNKKVKQKFPLI
jgi:predicted amidophosphoribosyltransferase